MSAPDTTTESMILVLKKALSKTETDKELLCLIVNILERQEDRIRSLEDQIRLLTAERGQETNLLSASAGPCEVVKESSVTLPVHVSVHLDPDLNNPPSGKHQQEEHMQDFKGFHNKTLWNFEDISKWMDCHLPILGGGETGRPCVSLRLQDANSPISILTDQDYWMDRLISTVPEVGMCYHGSECVKKFDVMKSEDSPNLENSSFYQNEVLELAQKIMSFVRKHTALEGHTYWLYHREDTDTVKLYNLTEYCKQDIHNCDNPYSVPVSVLCHQVGSSLIRTKQRTADVRTLFAHSIKLLDGKKHAQLLAEAHINISSLFVPDESVGSWQEKGQIHDNPTDTFDQTGGNEPPCPEEPTQNTLEDDTKNAVAMKELFTCDLKAKAWNGHITESSQERCTIALSHIRKGLVIVDEDLHNLADRKLLHAPLSTIWHPEARYNLLKTAAVSFFVQARNFFKQELFGCTLQQLRCSVQCYEAKQLLTETSETENSEELFMSLLYMAALTRFSIHSNWNSCREDLQELGENEAAILESAQSSVTTPRNARIFEWPTDKLSNLMGILDVYKQLLKLLVLKKKELPFFHSVKRSYADCMLATGCTQMELCKEEVYRKKKEHRKGFTAIKLVWHQILANLEKSFKLYEQCDDRNSAVSSCMQIASLYELGAKADAVDSPADYIFPVKENVFFSKMIEWYQKGLHICVTTGNFTLRETIHDSLRIYYHELAQLYLENPKGVRRNDLQCAKDLIEKSLNYCMISDSEENTKQCLIYTAANRLCLAKVFRLEAAHCNNPSSKNILIQKREENFKICIQIFSQIQWRRAQITCTGIWIESLLEHCEKMPLTSKDKQRLVTTVFSHFSDLHLAIAAIRKGSTDPEDNWITNHRTDISAVRELLQTFNAACCTLLKLDRSNLTVKQLYVDCLRLPAVVDLEDLDRVISLLASLKSSTLCR